MPFFEQVDNKNFIRQNGEKQKVQAHAAQQAVS